jgi:hypothetical protein
MSTFLGLRSLIYPTIDLAADRSLWIQILGKLPYFDEPFYVGFDMGGYEIGLHPESSSHRGPVTYVGVQDVPQALEHLTKTGCTVFVEPTDVGDGIIMAAVELPNGMAFGVIFNPHFKASA